MPLTQYMRKQILKMIAGKSSFSNYTYLALSTSAINADGTGIVEPSGNGYSRVRVDTVNVIGGTGTISAWPSDPSDTDSDGKYEYTNNQDITFPEATGSWGTITYFAIFTAQTGGNMIAYGALATPIAPVADTIPVVRAGQLTIEEE